MRKIFETGVYNGKMTLELIELFPYEYPKLDSIFHTQQLYYYSLGGKYAEDHLDLTLDEFIKSITVGDAVKNVKALAWADSCTEEIIAYAVAVINSNFICELKAIFVVEEFRKMKLGVRMWSTIQSHYLGHDIDRYIINVPYYCEVALQFFEKMGFNGSFYTLTQKPIRNRLDLVRVTDPDLIVAISDALYSYPPFYCLVHPQHGEVVTARDAAISFAFVQLHHYLLTHGVLADMLLAFDLIPDLCRHLRETITDKTDSVEEAILVFLRRNQISIMVPKSNADIFA